MAGRASVGVRKSYLVLLNSANDNRTGAGSSLIVLAAEYKWPGSTATPSAPRIAGA